ncbi:MAG: ABC transporter substrate-binding protein [Acidimicrobiales bacterium]
MTESAHEPTYGFRPGARVLVAALLALTVLASCGDDDDAAVTVPGGATQEDGGEGGGGEGEDTDADPASDEVGARLQEILQVDAADACGDETFPMGAVLALTGPGSFYGKTMSRGIDLAVEHVKAAGGPDIQVEYYDHKSGDPAAGQQAITELGENGFAAKLSSYVDDLGAMLPGTAQYEVFTIDGGGGTSIFGQGQPYFWGARAITPNDPLPGLFEYVKEAMPDATTVGLVGWDIGEPANTQIREDILEKIEAAGLEFNGLYELTAVGSQDYSQVLPKITSNEPDVLLMSLYGQDPGSFINQAQTAGLESQIVGFEFTPDGVNAAKGVYDQQGYTFAYDFFDANNPPNPLAELFVEEFESEYGELPDFYAANFYEDTLAMWDVIRRVCADGGDINSGAELDAALQDDPTFASVYGDDDESPGTFTFDLETHSVEQRPMGVFEYKDGEITPLAYFDLDAEDFRLAE